MDRGTGGFRVNYDELLAAQRAPTLDGRSFAMEAGAVGQAVGQAAQGLSEGMMQIAQKQFESINRRKVSEASAKLAAANDSIADFMAKEPDETKWLALFQGEAQKWESAILKDDTLSPAARDAIGSRISAWKITTESQVRRASFGESLKKEAAEMEGNRLIALNNKEWDKANQITDKQVELGIIHKDTAARQRIHTDMARKAAAKDDAWKAETVTIENDPEAYRKEHGKQRESETPEEYSRRMNYLENVERDNFRARQADAGDALANPDLKPEELEAKLAGMRPGEAQKWRDAYNEQRMEKLKVLRSDPKYINNLWGKLDDMVQGFDRNATDAREQYTTIRALAMQLPEGWRQHPLAVLDGKWSAKPPEPDKLLEAEIDDSIDGVYKSGGFGAVTRPITEGMNPVSGQWEKVQDGVEYVKTRPGKEALPEDQIQGPRGAKAALKIQMREMMKSHPEWRNDPQKAFDALNAARERQRDKSAPSVNFVAPTASLFPTPASAPAGLDSITGPAPSELPSGPESGPSTSLLPNPPPETAAGGAMWVADRKGGTTEVTPMTDEDVKRWRAGGDTAAKVWDLEKSQWVMRRPSELQAGKYAMPTNLFPQ